ncbi:hypothetical protein PISL3812_07402 [Talaromyces islandicus]|uniref:Uncharacterized protein n=1 Tax=Talaromyces islandicus TaxID=28573 RepID=A0A0U1M442_TALIS|nr:hypothetical protein PISL3812_07402 [Talaromyces islandicus]
MPGTSPVILILGTGPNIGEAVARTFASKGYKAALAAGHSRGPDSTDNQLHITSDFANPDDAAHAFTRVKQVLGIPSVVVYNAARIYRERLGSLTAGTNVGICRHGRRVVTSASRPDRSAFVAACTEAEADDGRLQAVLSRYFSTWKTSLMGDDLSRLQMLATHAQIRDYIKVIWLEDETEFEEMLLPSKSSVIWPRYESGQVIAEALGVELLKSMLAAQQLCPSRLEIRDKHTTDTYIDPEKAAILARDILHGTDLAVTEFMLRKESPARIDISVELSAEHQGQGIGFSMLRKARLYLSQDLYSFLAEDVLLHASALKELTLSFCQPRQMWYTPSFILHNATLPALEKPEISTASLSIPIIMAILSKSKQSLTGFSFRLMSLGKKSTWAELLSRICNEFPHLTWFEIGNLSEKSIRYLQITFPGLDKDSVIGEPYKNGLKVIKRGPASAKRISWVEYVGLDANHVLRIVAECAVATQL